MAGRKPIVLMRGMNVIPVGNLQEQLMYRGFPIGEVDNVFGLKTELAVRQFQASVGLPQTGIVDSETWRLLFEGIPLPDDACYPDDHGGWRHAGEPAESDARTEIKADATRQGLSMVVSLASRRLSLLRGDSEIAHYPVAIGKPATPTPIGDWSVLNKALNPGGVFGTRWMGFTRLGHGIHGTNQPQSIGHSVSNGCVRMYTPDVESLFAQVWVGVPVIVTAGVPAPETRPGTYVVQPGDTLYTVAQRFGTTVDAIRLMNHLVSDYLTVGQVLLVAVPSSAPPTTGTDYIVQPGDTLFLIARKFGTTAQAMMATNNLTSTNLYVGQRLRIPGGSRSGGDGHSPEHSGEYPEYVVQPGDTLSEIAAAFGRTPDALVQLNNLIGADVYPGQRLRLP